MNSLRLARLTVAKEDGLRRRMQAVSVRSNLTRQMTQYGFWTSEYEVDTALDKLPQGQWLLALQMQLKFRKTVLKQPGDRSLFAQSQKGKKHTWQILRSNLFTLITAASGIVPAADLFQIVGQKINHRFEEHSEER